MRRQRNRMSTKNDKTTEDLVLISKQMLLRMTLEEIEKWYFEHSSREFDAWCNSEYGISAYYGEKIIHDIFGIRKKKDQNHTPIGKNT